MHASLGSWLYLRHNLSRVLQRVLFGPLSPTFTH